LGDKRWSGNTGWTQHSNLDRNDLHSAGGTTATITLTLAACVGADVFAYCSPGGVLSYSIDGGAVVDWTIPASSPWRKLSLTGLANTAHTITFTTTAVVALSRVEPVYSTPGLTISNAGRSSSHAGNWLPLAWVNMYNTVFSVSNGAGVKPDLAIMNIGTNTGSSTLADIETVATNIKALGSRCCWSSSAGSHRTARSTTPSGPKCTTSRRPWTYP
jgi:hypothetical protein